jgi:hypothetical protein
MRFGSIFWEIAFRLSQYSLHRDIRALVINGLHILIFFAQDAFVKRDVGFHAVHPYFLLLKVPSNCLKS